MDAREAFETLGLATDVGLAELRAAYRRLLLEHHPDVAATGTTDADATRHTAHLIEAYRVAAAATLGTRPVPGAPVAGTPAGAGDVVRHDDAGQPAPPAVTIADSDTIAIAAPAPEAFAMLADAASIVGHIAYVDRQLGILEMIVRFEGGPSCSVLMTLQGRADGTEVFCTMDSIEAAPAPPITPVVDELTAALRGLR